MRKNKYEQNENYKSVRRVFPEKRKISIVAPPRPKKSIAAPPKTNKEDR